MANDRVFARCTADGCDWRVMMFKYYPSEGLLARDDCQAVVDEIADHWDSHDQPRDFDLDGNPGFRLATERTVD